MQKILDGIGVKGEVIGLTKRLPKPCLRGNEIYQWIEDHFKSIIDLDGVLKYSCNYRNYVIIDDDSDMLYWQKDNFVNTDGQHGITDRNAMQCIRILNTTYQPTDWGLL